MNIKDAVKASMTKVEEHFAKELKGMRSGRASSSLLENVLVEAYGSTTKISSVATIGAPEPRVLTVTPFDPQMVQAIAKGITAANLGVTVAVDGNMVRCNIPPLDEAARKKLATQVKAMGEEAKVGIRKVRQDGMNTAKKDDALTEDAKKRAEKDIQTLTDAACKKIDEMVAVKSKEVLTV